MSRRGSPSSNAARPTPPCWRALNDAASAIAVACERALLAELDGSCRAPIAGLAEIVDGGLRFRGLVMKPDGSAWHAVEMSGATADANRIGKATGQELLARAGPDFLASFRPS